MNTTQSIPEFSPSDNEKLADEISCLASHIHAATYRLLVLIREFDQREAWRDMGARSCVQWLNWRCGISPHTAREKLRVAHALATLDKIGASFERGELSYSKVRAVTRVANEDNEALLLNIALSGTASQLERVVRCDLRSERESEIKERTDAAFAQRAFSWKKCSDGTVEFFGRLPAELAEHVIRAIEANLPDDDVESGIEVNLREDESGSGSDTSVAGLENDFQGASPESGDCPGENLTKNVPAGTPENTARKLGGPFPDNGSVPDSSSAKKPLSETPAKNVPAGTSGGEGSVPGGVGSGSHPDGCLVFASSFVSETLIENVPAGTSASDAPKSSLTMRRADALIALCTERCTGYEVTLHVAVGKSPRANSLQDGGTIPMEAARRLCCDAAIIPVTEDSDGTVLDVGRRTRVVPTPMSRALYIRDKATCRFPGCTHTHFLHAHHIEHWAMGGKTCLDNLVLLCSYHHHLVHEGGFACEATTHRVRRGVNVVFKTPSGKTIADVFRLEPVAARLEDIDRHDDIRADTPVARDYGTRLDVGVVIDALEFVRRRAKKRSE